jgi:predicted P-loop ATPase
LNLPALSSSPLDFALYYASRNWPVFPLHSIKNEKCTCGAFACGRAGKHPRIENGLTGASTDPEVIRAWWRKWPQANIGLRTGNGLIVIDIDPRHGGTEGLAAVEQANAPLPPTLESATGGGGKHLLFSVTEELRNSAASLGNGVDVRGDGGYIVAPPSIHISGGTYQWASTDDVAALPQWVFEALRKPKAPLGAVPDNVIHGERNITLFKHGAKLRNQGFEYSEIFAALKAMNEGRCRPPLDVAEVHTIANSASKYEPGSAKPSVIDASVSLTDDDMWKHGIIFGKDRPQKTTANAALYITHHKDWAGKLIYDEFANKYLWRDTLPLVSGFTPPKPGEALDHHYSYVQQWLLAETNTQFTETIVCSAIRMAAYERAVHPVREYLTTNLTYDKIPRVSRWLSTYLGVADTPYARLVGKWWMISAVARVLDPGCKVDSLLIFEGETGHGKSKSVGILGGKWFSDTPIPLGDKDAYSNIQGMWIVELAELAALKGTGSSRAKAFFSSCEDRFRPAFEKSTRSFPRQCVFIGTTNEDEYLIDPTGGRRYWPVKCGAIDINALKRDRDQLWAEAVELYETERRWYPDTPEEVRLCKAEQDRRFVSDPWQELIGHYLSNLPEITVAEILDHLGVSRDKWDQNIQQRVAVCLKRLHWENKPEWLNGKTQRVYRKIK